MIEAGELAAYLEAQAELAPFWLVTGSEDLLKLESVDLIRERARALGYTDRQVLELAPSSDWSQLADSASAIGMFADKKLLEVRIPGGAPGIRGAGPLTQFVERPFEGVVTVFSMPRPGWQGEKSQMVDGARQGFERRRLLARAARSAAALARLAPCAQRSESAARGARALRRLGRRQPSRRQTGSRQARHSLRSRRTHVGKHRCVREQQLALRHGRTRSLDTFGRTRARRTHRDGLEAQAEPFPLILMMLTMQLRSVLRLSAAYARGQSSSRASSPPTNSSAQQGA